MDARRVADDHRRLRGVRCPAAVPAPGPARGVAAGGAGGHGRRLGLVSHVPPHDPPRRVARHALQADGRPGVARPASHAGDRLGRRRADDSRSARAGPSTTWPHARRSSLRIPTRSKSTISTRPGCLSGRMTWASRSHPGGWARIKSLALDLTPEQMRSISEAWSFWRREPERCRRLIRLVTANRLAFYDLPPERRPRPDPDVHSCDLYPSGPEAPAGGARPPLSRAWAAVRSIRPKIAGT